MDGSNRLVRRKSLKERLRFKGFGCCGATWGLRRADEDEGVINMVPISPEIRSTTDCFGQTPGRSGMNLATALAAERQFRAAHDIAGPDPSLSPSPSPLRPNNDVTTRNTPSTPYRVSLMRLLEETDACDDEQAGEGSDSVCCVCMVRKKGAAFIPCGHTFCRVCSRELWLNRGSCPLCSGSIVEILDIF